MGRHDADMCGSHASGVRYFLRRESAGSEGNKMSHLLFSKLLSVLAIGFAQGLYAIDAADGETEHGSLVFNALIQALLQ